MNIKEIYQKLDIFREQFVKWIAFLSTLTVAITFAVRFFQWGQGNPPHFISSNQDNIWFGAASILLITLWWWTIRLNRLFTYRFTDDFKGDPRDNWDFEGSWRVVNKGILLVTGSDAGGITKVGSLWENYTLTFEARIQKDCLGIIVRAADLNNYYMLQVRRDKIRPHRRVAVPVLNKNNITETKQINEKDIENKSDDEKITNALEFHPVSFVVGWQIMNEDIVNIEPELTGWFNVQVTVRGESIKLFIADELCFQKDSFLKLPVGKVGFRNNGEEAAFVRKVQVKVHP